MVIKRKSDAQVLESYEPFIQAVDPTSTTIVTSDVSNVIGVLINTGAAAMTPPLPAQLTFDVAVLRHDGYGSAICVDSVACATCASSCASFLATQTNATKDRGDALFAAGPTSTWYRFGAEVEHICEIAHSIQGYTQQVLKYTCQWDGSWSPTPVVPSPPCVGNIRRLFYECSLYATFSFLASACQNPPMPPLSSNLLTDRAATDIIPIDEAITYWCKDSEHYFTEKKDMSSYTVKCLATGLFEDVPFKQCLSEPSKAN